jgi:acetyl-CoA acyltransferase
MKTLNEAVIIAYGRAPIGKSGKKGAFRETHPVDLAGTVLSKVLAKIPQVDPKTLDDVIVACAKPEGVQGFNFARLIASRAACGWEVPGQTVNRFCASGLQAISTAANMIMTGQAEVIAAGGMESMTAIPMGSNPETRCKWIEEQDPGQYLSMGLTAENVAARYGVTREAMDAFAVESHKKAARAVAEGRIKEEIVPIPGVDAEGNPILLSEDQGVRPDSSLESLAGLKPAFKEDGRVTAGQASQVSDGCGFVILTSAEKAAKLGVKALARFLGFAVAGVDPSIMGVGPIKAVPKIMALTGLSVDQMDVIELNEAFAAQAIPCIRELGLDPVKVNPNGGAIALGHPLGATGAILTCKAISELRRIGGKYGLITMCVGGGMGAAGILERLS